VRKMYQNLNGNETKGIIVEFRKTRHKPNTISVFGEEVVVVKGYIYIGVYLYNRLNWKYYTETVYKNRENRLFFEKALVLQCLYPDVTSL